MSNTLNERVIEALSARGAHVRPAITGTAPEHVDVVGEVDLGAVIATVLEYAAEVVVNHRVVSRDMLGKSYTPTASEAARELRQQAEEYRA